MMIQRLIKPYKKILTTLCVVSFLLLSNLSWALSKEGETKTENQKAMYIAEERSKGKAIGAKLVQKGNRKGYRVRILKNGKITHLFIPLIQLRK